MPRVQLDRIEPDPDQPRKIFTVSDLEILAASIKQNGLIQPPTVRTAERRGYYYLNTGERRWRAHKLLVERGEKEFSTIDVIVQEPTNVVSLRVRQVVENVARADFKPLEEARAYAELVKNGLSVEDAARRVGIPLHIFKGKMALLDLEPSIAALVASEQFDRNHALEIARLPRHEDQLNILRMINRGEIGHWRSVRQAVNTMLEGTTAADLFGASSVKASSEDVASLNMMEQKIDRVSALLAKGWKDGECIIANRVSPDRASLMADKLMAIRGTVRTMEKELRNVTAQARIALSTPGAKPK
jgi:ParB family chromosome partitioning protein